MGKIWMPGGGGGADLDVITAGAGDVLAGKVIVDKEGELLTGTMPNRGASGGLLQAGQTYTIPAGYHNGSGTVAANNLAGQTGATAAAAHILNGQTAWVNGNKITGNMPNYSTTPTPIDAIRINNNRFEVAVAAGCHGYSWAGNGYEYMSYDQVANAIGLTPAKLKKGEWVCGRTGTFEGWVPTANDIYVRGNNIAGFTHSTYGTVTYQAGGMQLTGDAACLSETSASDINLSPYNYLNIEGYYERRGKSLTEQNTTFAIQIRDGSTVVAQANNAVPAGYSNFTTSVYIGPIALSKRITIRLGFEGQYWYDGNDGRYWISFTMGSWIGWVYRIWLS